MSSNERDIPSGEPTREKKNYAGYQMIFFDMDGTLILTPGYQENSSRVGVSVWHAIFDSVGAIGEHKRLKEKFEKGEYSSYMDWTDEECGILKQYGLTESKLSEVIDKLPFVKGAKEAVPELKRLGYKTAIITGGVLALARRVQRELKMDDVMAHCDFIFDEKGMLEKWILLPCDYEDKAKTFLQMTKKHGTVPEKCIYIGNDVNDKAIFPIVGLPVIFNPSRKEAKETAVIYVGGSDDMREPLQSIGVLPAK
jgi:phosphoserine phosphatase